MNLRTARVTLKSITAYSQSKHFEPDETSSTETHKTREERMWRNRMHVNEGGFVVMPAMGFKLALADCAKFLSKSVPGKGKATFTKHFEAGVMVADALVTTIKADDVKPEPLFVPSDGKRGGGSRVLKYFPLIPHWSGVIEFVLIDDTITEAVFLEHLEASGQFIGVGRFRPRNNGYYGRFSVSACEWSVNGKRYEPVPARKAA